MNTANGTKMFDGKVAFVTGAASGDVALKLDIESELRFDPEAKVEAALRSIEDAAHAAWAAPGVTEASDQVKMQMTTS